jgi:hypothetical protein
MSQSLLLPAFVALFGVVAAIFLIGFSDAGAARRPDGAGVAAGRTLGRSSAVAGAIRTAPPG